MSQKPSKFEQQSIIPTSVSPERGIELINRQIENGKDSLNNRPLTSERWTAWKNTTRDEFLIKIFGSNLMSLKK